MNKRRKTTFLLTITSLLLFGGDLFGTAEAFATDNVISLGYNSQTAPSFWSTPRQQQGDDESGHTYHAAICLPSNILNKYVGDKIESIQFALSKKTATHVLAFVVSDDLDNVYMGKTLATVSTSDFTEGWNTLQLNQPVTIEKDMTLFVGYVLTIPSGSDVTGIPFETYGIVDQGSTYFGLDYQWWDITASGMTYCLPLRALCSGENVPNNDIDVKQLSSSANYYVEKNSQATYTAWIRNYGLDAVNSIKFSVEANGNVSDDVFVDGLNIEHGKQVKINIPGIKAPVEGDFSISLTATEVNGKPDPELSDNESTTFGFAWREGGNPVPRTVLLEHFTNENYNEAKTVDDCYKQWMGTEADVVWVKHHIATSKFDADQFYNEEEKTYEELYGATKTDVPFISVDRCTFSGMTDDGPAYFVADENQFKTILSSVQDVPSFINLEIENALSSNQQLLTTEIQVSSEAYEMPGETDLRLTTWLVEDSVESTSQKGVKGTYLQNGVLRAIVSNSVWGDAIDITNYSDSKSYTINLDPTWNVSNLRVVSFANNYNASERKRYVYNTTQKAINSSTSIAGIQPTGEGKLDAIYDLSGRQMKSETLPTGIYVVKTTTGTKKVVIK